MIPWPCDSRPIKSLFNKLFIVYINFVNTPTHYDTDLYVYSQISVSYFPFQVDLKCISDGSGGFYYKNHLPKLGQSPESLIIPSTSNQASSLAVNTVSFEVGERVRVTLDVATLKDLQEGHGGWNDKMEEVL